MPDETDEAADVPGHIVQGLLRERDDARAIARRLANTLRARNRREFTSETGYLLLEFDALPWAKDDT
jgi:hypothetical protein